MHNKGIYYRIIFAIGLSVLAAYLFKQSKPVLAVIVIAPALYFWKSGLWGYTPFGGGHAAGLLQNPEQYKTPAVPK